MKRIFIAINLPSEVKSKLIKLQEELALYLPYVRWTKLENLHLTLVFLGWLEEEKIKEGCQITKEVVEEIEPFALTLAGLGVFPEPRRPRILWVGVGGDSILKHLNQALFRKLTQTNFVLDEREFTAHLTIGRIQEQKPSKEAIFFAINKFKNTEFGKVEVKSLEVMESILRREGPIYRVIKKIKLRE